MISKTALSRAVARLRLTKFFPGSDADLLTALAVELKSLCATDAELAEIVDASIKAGDGEWPGLGGIHEAARAMRRKRQIETEKAAARAERDEHERTCVGYLVTVDSEWKDVHVRLCDKGWKVETTFLPGSGWMNETVCRCRVSDRLADSRALIERIEAEKLSEYGWSKRQRVPGRLTDLSSLRASLTSDADDDDGIPFD